MPSTKPTRTARRLLKIASLGLAGFLAGLLAGCSSSSLHLFDAPSAQNTLTATRITDNPDYPPAIPTLRHAPVPHYVQPLPQRANREAYAIVSQIDPDHTLATYPTGRYLPGPSRIYGQ